MTDLSDIQVSLDERHRTIARLRRQARERYGRDKRTRPLLVVDNGKGMGR
jgi:hypothetical protein